MELACWELSFDHEMYRRVFCSTYIYINKNVHTQATVALYRLFEILNSLGSFANGGKSANIRTE